MMIKIFIHNQGLASGSSEIKEMKRQMTRSRNEKMGRKKKKGGKNNGRKGDDGDNDDKKKRRHSWKSRNFLSLY